MEPDSSTQPAPVTQPAPAADPQPAVASQPTVPDQWPGAFGVFKYSKQAVKLNFGTLAIFWVISAVLGTILRKQGHVGELVSLVVSSFAAAGYALTFIASVRGQQLSFGEAAKHALNLWLKMIGLTVLVLVSLTVSFLLLIVPFFFVLPRLSLANYFLVDKNMGVLEAYKASWHATKGNSGKVWGIYGVTILFAVLMLVLVGIYLVIVYSAAIAVLYEYLNRNPAPQAAEAPATQPPAVSESQPPTAPTPPAV